MPPVAVFAYNRPKHLKLTLEALKRSEEYLGKPLSYTIFCDAPKVPEHEEWTEKTRAVAKAFGKGEVIFREHNLGFKNITDGITALTDAYGRAIIIEDDVVVSPDFLPYMVKALDKYKDDPRVFMASGFMYHGAASNKPDSFFLPSSFIWGWGTWQRAWKNFSYDPEDWKSLLENKESRNRFDFFGAFPFSKMLEKTMQGKIVTWDIQWMYAMFKAGGLGLYPHKSLVWNTGVGGGTHGKLKLEAQDPYTAPREFYLHGDMELEEFRPRLGKEIAFPQQIICDEKAMRLLSVTFLQQRLRTATKKRLRLKLKLLIAKLQASVTQRPKVY